MYVHFLLSYVLVFDVVVVIVVVVVVVAVGTVVVVVAAVELTVFGSIDCGGNVVVVALALAFFTVVVVVDVVVFANCARMMANFMDNISNTDESTQVAIFDGLVLSF